MANTSTLISRRDYGMKIAMPGFDLSTATDNQLLFNSSFPILQIKVFASLGYITAASSGSGTDAEKNSCNFGGEYLGMIDNLMVWRWYHGLGFPPLYLPIGSNGVTFGAPFSVDENYIYYTSNVYSPVIGWNGVYEGAVDRCLICPIDISKDIEYPYTALPLDMNYGVVGDYGFKSVEYGDIKDTDFQNLGINPRLQAQMVLAVKTSDTKLSTSNNIEYQLPTGITTNDVMVYVFRQHYSSSTGTNIWSHIYAYGQSPPSVLVDPTNNIVGVYYASVTTDKMSAIITRQPMVADTKLEFTL
jgi:hypothetical protein